MASLPTKAPTISEVIAFYAAPANWQSPSTGFALQVDRIPSPVEQDRGDMARQALMLLAEPQPANMPDLAAAFHKFAPDLAQELLKRYREATVEALQDFLKVLGQRP